MCRFLCACCFSSNWAPLVLRWANFFPWACAIFLTQFHSCCTTSEEIFGFDHFFDAPASYKNEFQSPIILSCYLNYFNKLPPLFSELTILIRFCPFFVQKCYFFISFPLCLCAKTSSLRFSIESLGGIISNGNVMLACFLILLAGMLFKLLRSPNYCLFSLAFLFSNP